MPSDAPTSAGEVIVAARLRPGAGAAYGLPACEIRDQRVPVTDLGLDPHDELHAELDPDEVLTRITSLVARLLLATPVLASL